MAQESKIEWTDKTWNFLRGCSRVSEGCRNCYAERQAIRHAYAGGPYHELVKSTPAGPRWTGKVEFFEHVLVQPLSWKKPCKIFVNSMSDLFHEDVKDEWLDMAFAVMALTPQHTYQILTKRPKRMREYFWNIGGTSRRDWVLSAAGRLVNQHSFKGFPAMPLPNVWLGVSCEDQKTANERIPLLLETPAAIRWVSAEPLLGSIDFTHIQFPNDRGNTEDWNSIARCVMANGMDDPTLVGVDDPILDWIVVGGESGPNARSFDISWARSIVDQCQSAGVLVFVKQLGADPIDWRHDVPEAPPYEFKFDLSDRKGGNPDDWPDDLRVRQMPEVTNV